MKGTPRHGGIILSTNSSPLKKKRRGLPWRSSGKDSVLPTEASWVQSLIRDEIPPVSWSKNKNKKNTQKGQSNFFG